MTVADVVPFKLDTAAALGADHTVLLTDAPAANIDALRQASDAGDGYDIVVEARSTTGVTAVSDIGPAASEWVIAAADQRAAMLHPAHPHEFVAVRAR